MQGPMSDHFLSVELNMCVGTVHSVVGFWISQGLFPVGLMSTDKDTQGVSHVIVVAIVALVPH